MWPAAMALQEVLQSWLQPAASNPYTQWPPTQSGDDEPLDADLSEARLECAPCTSCSCMHCFLLVCGL